MLGMLHIENIAVIECADIQFEPGFNVLTGETGAGKSIVIDAISAILGQRAYRDAIRTGSRRACISAVFQNVPEYPWFQENHIPCSGEVLIQREIYADGRNACRVCGQPVTVAMLRQLGERLIQIHGQHDAVQLFDEANHRSMLDAYAGHTDLLAEYRAAYTEMDELRRRIRSMTMDEAEKARRMETLQYQIQEIDRASLREGEDEELAQKQRMMRSGETLKAALDAAADALYGGEDSDGAAALTMQAAQSLSEVSGTSDAAAELCQLVEELRYSVQDAAEQVRDLRDSLDFSPEALEEVENRLDVIHRLRRKYGQTCGEILEYRDRCARELDEITLSDETMVRLRRDLKEKKRTARTLADRLTASRQDAAESFSRQLTEELRQLDMPSVQFRCEISPLPHLDETGGDSCRFLMSANVGEELRQMSHAASGGELARIMLAVENVLSEKDEIPTLIFDEVDTGVSGRAALKVAEKLCSVSRGKQVLCVTHLPQIAAAAGTHFLIEKEEQAGRTFTSVTPLDRVGRTSEIARLIGGARITENTRRSAEEMLSGG